MQKIQNTAQAATRTLSNDICGCLTFGGITFIMTALVFLMTNDAAQAVIHAAQ